MAMKIDKPTYLIAELEGDIEKYVTDLRNQFNPERVLWPIDITIAGSSGLGPILEGQALNLVISEIEKVISTFYFDDVVFNELDRFTNTSIYFLKPTRDKFDVLHEALNKSKVLFNANPWPYNPHCTLCSKSESNKELDLAFSEAAFPKTANIRCFSLYQPYNNGGYRLYKFE